MKYMHDYLHFLMELEKKITRFTFVEIQVYTLYILTFFKIYFCSENLNRGRGLHTAVVKNQQQQ